MTDYTEEGAVPVVDAAVPAPPTVDEVQRRQAEEYPDLARTAMRHDPATTDEVTAVEAGGEPVDDSDGLRIEGRNPA